MLFQFDDKKPRDVFDCLYFSKDIETLHYCLTNKKQV